MIPLIACIIGWNDTVPSIRYASHVLSVLLDDAAADIDASSTPGQP